MQFVILYNFIKIKSSHEGEKKKLQLSLTCLATAISQFYM